MALKLQFNKKNPVPNALIGAVAAGGVGYLAFRNSKRKWIATSACAAIGACAGLFIVRVSKKQ